MRTAGTEREAEPQLDQQPYLQRKPELQAEEKKRAQELEAEERKDEVDGEHAIREMLEGPADLIAELAHQRLPKLRGDHDPRELEGL